MDVVELSKCSVILSKAQHNQFIENWLGNQNDMYQLGMCIVVHHRKTYHTRVILINVSLPPSSFYKNEEDDAPIKRCPKCKVYIERDEGCAQMMCKNCKHAFCWYCLESLDVSWILTLIHCKIPSGLYIYMRCTFVVLCEHIVIMLDIEIICLTEQYIISWGWRRITCIVFVVYFRLLMVCLCVYVFFGFFLVPGWLSADPLWQRALSEQAGPLQGVRYLAQNTGENNLLPSWPCCRMWLYTCSLVLLLCTPFTPLFAICDRPA